MKFHELKVTHNNWEKYEYRDSSSIRENDRDFKVGDLCIFRKWDKRLEKGPTMGYSGEYIMKKILFIHEGMGMKDNFVVLSIRTLFKSEDEDCEAVCFAG